jgi:hypothetical protein
MHIIDDQAEAPPLTKIETSNDASSPIVKDECGVHECISASRLRADACVEADVLTVAVGLVAARAHARAPVDGHAAEDGGDGHPGLGGLEYYI